MALSSILNVANIDRGDSVNAGITLRFAAANLLNYARTHLCGDATLGKTMGIVRAYRRNSSEYNKGDSGLHLLFTLTPAFGARLIPTVMIDENAMNTAVESTYTQYPQD